MLTESIIIFFIIAFIAAGYAATKKKYAVATIPLVILPAANIAAYFICGPLAAVIPAPPFVLYTVLIVLALTATAITVSFISMKFRSKRIRAVYTGISVAFEAILACIFIYDMFCMIYRNS